MVALFPSALQLLPECSGTPLTKPHTLAWERLGTDKIFSSAFARKLRRDKPRRKRGKKWVWRFAS
jgi:hypothetical protein